MLDGGNKIGFSSIEFESSSCKPLKYQIQLLMLSIRLKVIITNIYPVFSSMHLNDIISFKKTFANGVIRTWDSILNYPLTKVSVFAIPYVFLLNKIFYSGYLI